MTLKEKQSIKHIDEWINSFSKSNSYIKDFSGDSPILINYEQLVEKIKLQSIKWGEIGILPGSTVLLAIPSNSTLIIHILSLMNIGAVPVPVSNLLSKESYKFICKNVKPVAIYAKAKDKLFSSIDFTLVEHNFEGKYNLLINDNEPYINKELENCIILTTSGSTGFPKSVVHKNSNSILNALLHMESIDEDELEAGTYIATLPFFFSYGLIAGILGALLKEKNIIIPEQPFYPSNWRKSCLEHNVTYASLTPGVLKKILKANINLPNTLNKVTIGGELADLKDIRSLKELFKGDIYLTYGLSEAGPRVSTNHLSESNDWNLMGKPMTNIHMNLINIKPEEGFEIGELIVDTPTAMLGYLVDGQLVKHEEFINHWLITGDICKRIINTDKYFYVERKKNTIKCAGENLYPGIIRKVILSHPSVDEVKIQSEIDDRLGYVPIALVKLKSGEKVIPHFKEWCLPRLRLIEIPRRFEIVQDLEVFKK